MGNHQKAQRVPTRYVLLSFAAPTSAVTCPEGTRGLLIGTGGALDATLSGGPVNGLPAPAGLLAGEFVSVGGPGTTAENIYAVV